MRKVRTILSRLFILFGVCCLLYPFVSTWYNNRKNTFELDVYKKSVAEQVDYSSELYKADLFNKKLVHMPGRFNMSGKMLEEYNSLLNVNDVMAYVEIPKISVVQPVHHGTDQYSLSYGVGHYIGSSLPVGGSSTHCVLSGHTGMASQLMFTNLVDLEIGDEFFVTCLNRKLTYQVDQIKTVLPSDSSLLEIYENEDYCTLITCVPLGVNSHRLLVRGKCIGYSKAFADDEISKTKRVVTTLDKINWFLVALAILLLSYFVYVTIVAYKLKKQKREIEERRKTAVITTDKEHNVVIKYKKDKTNDRGGG